MLNNTNLLNNRIQCLMRIYNNLFRFCYCHVLLYSVHLIGDIFAGNGSVSKCLLSYW